MAVTRSFKKMVDDRLERDPGFREALLRESVETMLAGDMETEVRSARLHQGHDWLYGAGGGDRDASQKPDPHVWAKGQSQCRQPVQGSQSSAKEGGNRVTYSVRHGRRTRGTRARVRGNPAHTGPGRQLSNGRGVITAVRILPFSGPENAREPARCKSTRRLAASARLRWRQVWFPARVPL